MLETGIAILVAAIVVIAIFYIVSIWIYKRAPSNMCFIRTGFLGTKVCLGKGAIVLPVFHEVTWVSLETIKLIVSRSRDQAILTQDNIRVDVNTELYAHVGHNDEDVLKASRSLGEKTFDAEKVRALLEAKVVSALRSYAATKTLRELHENRDAFARGIKENVIESFAANGLSLEEVTIVTMEQASKEYFKTDNVFDAEGLKVITEITSEARRKVHDTEKRTTVSIRQKELDTQLELLEIERHEAVARANQDKEIANEQAKQLGEKQIFVLDRRMSVEEREIENEKNLERLRTERDIAVTKEAERREISEIQKALALERESRDREIALIAKAQEEELANIGRNLTLEKAEKDRQIELVEKTKEAELAEISRALVRERAEKEREIELSAKERERQETEIGRATAVLSAEEKAKDQRHRVAEETSLSMRRRTLETRLAMLELDRDEAFAAARQKQEISNEQARILSEQQRFILERRLEVEREEIAKAQELETAQIRKDISVIDETRAREAAEIRRQLAREQEERDREIALVAKAQEHEQAEIRRQLAREAEDRARQIALVARDGELRRAEIEQSLAVEVEERNRDIALIAKEQEREKADIKRFLARESEERDREIALVEKTRELEEVEIKKLQISAERSRAESGVDAARRLAVAETARELDRIEAETLAANRAIDEENKAQVARMHMITQAEARKLAATEEANATLTRAKASSEAQKIVAEGIEREAGATGRAEMEIEMLRVQNAQRMLEAEAAGIEAKAGALKKYDDAATFLELAKVFIEAERDVHVDQAKAMGSALSGAQIRMYGGGGGSGKGDGTLDSIRGLFTTGFGLGEALEGFAQSLPEGLRERFAANGLRGLFGRPYTAGSLHQAYEQLDVLVQKVLRTKEARAIPFAEAIAMLEAEAGSDRAASEAVAMLKEMNRDGSFDDTDFDRVWSLLQAAARIGDR
tara:strand:+ start:254 stop:3091 length:2838 start_codon:yes stop_codon:yes gene_type:complete